MNLSILLWVSSPITWLIVMMMLAGWRHMFHKPVGKPEDAGRTLNVGASTPDAVGTALLFMVMAHRPSHEFVGKARIVEREETDEDDNGGPDTPRKHFMRQLRQIRRGDAVDRLVWRLE